MSSKHTIRTRRANTNLLIGGPKTPTLLEEYESDSEDVARRGVGKRAHCSGSSSSEGEELTRRR